MNNLNSNLRGSFAQSLTLLISCFFICLLLGAFASYAFTFFSGPLTAKAVRISIILQNLIVFIAPALIASVFISNNPIKFLNIGKKPQAKYIILLIAIYIISTPAMNWLVEWNQNIHLPSSLQSVEELMRNMESDAESITKLLLNNNSVPGLIITVLIVGVLTGFGEEIFFRGALQKTLLSKPMNVHIAIWITAFIFSLLHFQFFGFIPRLFLGAFFGYLLVWSGSLWIPIIAHALNNSGVVIINYFSGNQEIENIGANSEGIPFLAIVSILLTLLILYAVNFYHKRNNIF